MPNLLQSGPGETAVRPAALFIVPITPSDHGNGLAMRARFLLRAYAERFAVDLVVIPLAERSSQLGSFPMEDLRRAIVLPIGDVDTHFRLVNALKDAKSRLTAFRDYGRPSLAAGLTPDILSRLRSFAGDNRYALIHVSRLYLAGVARGWTDRAATERPRLVLDCDEDDVNAYRRLAQLYRKWGQSERADWASAESDAFARLAREWLPRFDVVLASSAGEADALARRGGAEITVVPNIVQKEPVNAGLTSRRGRRDILFVGNMSYFPNIDAATWFASRILPKLRHLLPFKVRFVVAGGHPSRQVADLARREGIVVVGKFEDTAAPYRRASLAVIPIRAGGGTRIKLLEAAAYGVPMVATSFGASGCGFRSGLELLLADSEADFAHCCARLLRDPGLASRLAAAAKRRLRREFDAKTCAQRFLAKIGA
jgi:glycosyltransferase involved in cell wall biosynthesis